MSNTARTGSAFEKGYPFSTAAATATAAEKGYPLSGEAPDAPAADATAGTYREHEPPAALRPYVACIWTRRARPSGTARVLPDGCVDLLFDLVEPGSRFVGAMTRPLVVAENGGSRWLGVRFRPGGAFPFLRFNLDSGTDSQWDLRLVWPEADVWAEELALSTSLGDTISTIDEILLRKLDQLGSPLPDVRVRRAANLLLRTGGAISAATLSERLGLSRQHLNRLFRQHVGLGVKRFARIARLQASTHLLRHEVEGSSSPGATLAARAGFFDQSHFISEFKSLAGVTPAQFLVEEQSRRRLDSEAHPSQRDSSRVVDRDRLAST